MIHPWGFQHSSNAVHANVIGVLHSAGMTSKRIAWVRFPIPSSMKDKELEITIRPVRIKSPNMGRLYSNPIKVDTLVIPTREERNAR